MNIFVFLPLLLVGLGILVAGAISMSMGRKRRPLMLAIGGGLIGLAAAAGALVPTGDAVAATPKGGFAFLYPAEAEALDAQDFILEGTGVAGSTLEVFKNGVAEGKTTVDASGAWSYYVPQQPVGEYQFEVKAPDGNSIKRKLSVQQGLISASNAKCPCRVRIGAFTNGRLPVLGEVILFKDGKEVARANTSAVIGKLEPGEYTYSVLASGYKPFEDGKLQTPKNKNILVYLPRQ
ncbi:MAG: hypothetical protein ACK41E_04780 [Deinococcales bacterium]